MAHFATADVDYITYKTNMPSATQAGSSHVPRTKGKLVGPALLYAVSVFASLGVFLFGECWWERSAFHRLSRSAPC